MIQLYTYNAFISLSPLFCSCQRRCSVKIAKTIRFSSICINSGTKSTLKWLIVLNPCNPSTRCQFTSGIVLIQSLFHGDVIENQYPYFIFQQFNIARSQHLNFLDLWSHFEICRLFFRYSNNFIIIIIRSNNHTTITIKTYNNI